jgi:hypothetical protein
MHSRLSWRELMLSARVTDRARLPFSNEYIRSEILCHGLEVVEASDTRQSQAKHFSLLIKQG